jgi:hypothetical protein
MDPVYEEVPVTASEINGSRHPGSKRFHALLQELADLHDMKQKDYGTAADPFANVRAAEEFGLPAWMGAGIRINDKVQRLKSLQKNGSLVDTHDSIEDTFKDLAVYAIIGLCLYEEERQKEPDQEMADMGEAGWHPPFRFCSNLHVHGQHDWYLSQGEEYHCRGRHYDH